MDEKFRADSEQSHLSLASRSIKQNMDRAGGLKSSSMDIIAKLESREIYSVLVPSKMLFLTPTFFRVDHDHHQPSMHSFLY